MEPVPSTLPIVTAYFFEIYVNMVFSSHPQFSEWQLFKNFDTKTVYVFLVALPINTYPAN
jgi:hypothetical protein